MYWLSDLCFIHIVIFIQEYVEIGKNSMIYGMIWNDKSTF